MLQISTPRGRVVPVSTGRVRSCQYQQGVRYREETLNHTIMFPSLINKAMGEGDIFSHASKRFLKDAYNHDKNLKQNSGKVKYAHPPPSHTTHANIQYDWFKIILNFIQFETIKRYIWIRSLDFPQDRSRSRRNMHCGSRSGSGGQEGQECMLPA